jgi:hypothetical protein
LTREELTLSGRLGVDRKRVHGSGKFVRKRRIDHAMSLDPALPFEGLRHNMNSEMRLATRPVAGMALMQMGLVLDLEALWKESFAQLICDSVLGRHMMALNLATAFRQCRARI